MKRRSFLRTAFAVVGSWFIPNWAKATLVKQPTALPEDFQRSAVSCRIRFYEQSTRFVAPCNFASLRPTVLEVAAYAGGISMHHVTAYYWDVYIDWLVFARKTFYDYRVQERLVDGSGRIAIAIREPWVFNTPQVTVSGIGRQYEVEHTLPADMRLGGGSREFVVLRDLYYTSKCVWSALYALR